MFRKLGRLIDNALFYLKWPCAIVCVVLFPGAASALLALIVKCVTAPKPVVAFLVGIAVYLAVWWRFIRFTRISFLLVLEHEITHAIFAWLTFHRVTGLKATWRRGGRMEFLGQGNWLITIAPYFFPTLSVMVLLGCWLFSDGGSWFCDALLGISLAYHITSTIGETGAHQTDLQKVGFPFAFLFLPTANILLVGAIIGFTYGGGAQMIDFFASAGKTTAGLFDVLLKSGPNAG